MKLAGYTAVGRITIPLRIVFSSIIVLVTILAFIPTLSNGFTNWDDDTYVVNNPDIKEVSFQNIKKVFSTAYIGNYQPFTLLLYLAEYRFFKLNATGYHSVSLVLHIVNSLLLFALIYSLLGQGFTSLLAAVLFAIHPLRVESVAWIAEQKDLLSAFFYFLALLAYIRYLKNNRKELFGFSIIFMVFSLLSKPMAVSFPFVLLLIDFLNKQKIDKINLLSKLPFFGIAVLFIVITVITQTNIHSLAEQPYAISNVPALYRFCAPFYGMVFYLVKMIVPYSLSAYYPYPSELNSVSFLLPVSPFIVIGSAAALFAVRKIPRKVVFALLFYVVTLLPVLQIIPVGNTIVAERYSYIPSIGICIVMAVFSGFPFEKLFRSNRFLKAFFLVVVVMVISTFSWLTFSRCKVWKDSISLWSNVIAQFPVAGAYNSRGVAHGNNGDVNKAIQDFNQAISSNPTYSLAYGNRGLVFNRIGENERAIEDFTRSITLTPNVEINYINRGIAFKASGDFDRAVADFSEAIRLNPKNTDGFFNRGVIYSMRREYDNAVDDYSKALQIKPQAMLYNNRGIIYKTIGEINRAIADFSAAIDLDRGYANAYCNRGVAYFQIGDHERAISDLSQSVNLNPNSIEAHFNRSLVYKATGYLELAFEDMKTACDLGSGQACKSLVGMF